MAEIRSARPPITDAGGFGAFVLLAVLAVCCTGGIGLAGQLQSLAIYGGAPVIWVMPVAVAVAIGLTWPLRYEVLPEAFQFLLRGVVLLAALYGALHMPDAPLVATNGAVGELAHWLLWPSYWLMLVAVPLALWRPAVALVPACYGLWCQVLAGLASDFPNAATYDFRPMSFMIVGALGALAAHHWLGRGAALIGGRAERLFEDTRSKWRSFSMWFAIGTHLATYFAAGMAKLDLSGPFGAWIYENRVAYFMLPSSEAQILMLQRWPWAQDLLYRTLDSTQLLVGAGILAVQLLAAVIMIGPRRFAVALLLMLDLMHLGIWLTAAALFWTWILLNLLLAAVFLRAKWNRESLLPRALAVLTVVLTYWIGGPIRLGWFDTPAYNNIAIYAETEVGHRVAVPTMFFRQYGYYFSGYPYGGPPPGPYMVSNTRGMARDFETMSAARDCHENVTLVDETPARWQGERIAEFLRAYHAQALDGADENGRHAFRWYPHHTGFLARRGPIDDLDLATVRAYVIVGEAVCLAWRDGALQRTVHGRSEYRIDLDPA